MSQNRRLGLAVLILLGIAALILGLEALRAVWLSPASESDLPPGAIPVYLDGELAAFFLPDDLEPLQLAGFVDTEEGKTQEGWLLRDILLLYMPPVALDSGTRIVVTSSSQAKSVELTWDEVADPDNWVMLDLSGRGTLKLVSTLERLDTRNEWVQDIDRLEVFLP